ncbi:MAG: VOC family protein [Trueperaceae bacterium]
MATPPPSRPAFTTGGLHHVTAIAGRPQANIDFYVRVLGLRLVKRTVNYDDPETYHFYFGDAEASPGTLLTFFPWPGAGPGVRGAGETAAIALRAPASALDAWRDRLRDHDRPFATFERFSQELVAFEDPDGTPLELVAATADQTADRTDNRTDDRTDDRTERGDGPPTEIGDEGDGRPDATPAFRRWTASPVPQAMALGAMHSVTITAPRLDETATLLTERFGLRSVGEEREASGAARHRFAAGGPARPSFVDLLEAPSPLPGRWGAGSIHHVAFRASDDAAHADARAALLGAGLPVTKVKDRHYFRSIYVTEPGGAILEVATDGPGFTVDEPLDELGLALKLPPWLEPERTTLRGRLPVTASPEYADRWSERRSST